MEFTTVLTLFFSSAAIIISVINLYFQFFHKKTAIIGRRLQCHYTHDLKDIYDYLFEYSISNVGNQQILLSEVEWYLHAYKDNSVYDGQMILGASCPDLPCTIKPGEIKPLKTYVGNKWETIKLTEEIRKNKFTFILFRFVSVEVKTYDIYHEIDMKTLLDNNPQYFTLKDAVIYKPHILFQESQKRKKQLKKQNEKQN